jgi:hypothetical protein
MNFRKLAIIFSIIMGSCMIIMWIVFIGSNSVPEIQTKPLEFFLYGNVDLYSNNEFWIFFREKRNSFFYNVYDFFIFIYYSYF